MYSHFYYRRPVPFLIFSKLGSFGPKLELRHEVRKRWLTTLSSAALRGHPPYGLLRAYASNFSHRALFKVSFWICLLPKRIFI